MLTPFLAEFNILLLPVCIRRRNSTKNTTACLVLVVRLHSLFPFFFQLYLLRYFWLKTNPQTIMWQERWLFTGFTYFYEVFQSLKFKTTKYMNFSFGWSRADWLGRGGWGVWLKIIVWITDCTNQMENIILRFGCKERWWYAWFCYKQGNLKSETIKNLEKYIHRDDRLPILLNRWGTEFTMSAFLGDDEKEKFDEEEKETGIRCSSIVFVLLQ